VVKSNRPETGALVVKSDGSSRTDTGTVVVAVVPTTLDGWMCCGFSW